MQVWFLKTLSWLWPIRLQRLQGRQGELELVWENGRLVVNSANANQSFGSLHRVWQQCFAELGMRERPPANVLVLGFGAGSIAHILRKELHLSCPITGVDHDPAMLRIARERFGAEALADLVVCEGDAFDWVRSHAGHFDLIIVDLFHDLDFAEGMLDPAFLAHLRRLASAGGHVLINTVVYDGPSSERSTRLGRELRLHFDTVKASRHEGNNRVFIAL